MFRTLSRWQRSHLANGLKVCRFVPCNSIWFTWQQGPADSALIHGTLQKKHHIASPWRAWDWAVTFQDVPLHQNYQFGLYSFCILFCSLFSIGPAPKCLGYQFTPIPTASVTPSGPEDQLGGVAAVVLIYSPTPITTTTTTTATSLVLFFTSWDLAVECSWCHWVSQATQVILSSIPAAVYHVTALDLSMAKCGKACK